MDLYFFIPFSGNDNFIIRKFFIYKTYVKFYLSYFYEQAVAVAITKRFFSSLFSMSILLSSKTALWGIKKSFIKLLIFFQLLFHNGKPVAVC